MEEPQQLHSDLSSLVQRHVSPLPSITREILLTVARAGGRVSTALDVTHTDSPTVTDLANAWVEAKRSYPLV